MMKNCPVSVMFPKDLLKKIDENEFTRNTSRADFVRTAVNDFFKRMEIDKGAESHEQKKER